MGGRGAEAAPGVPAVGHALSQRHAEPNEALDRDGRAGPGSLEALYAAHRAELFAFVLHAVREPGAAEDVTHEAFLRLWRELCEGDAPRDPRAWLFRVATNLVISRARRSGVADRHRACLAATELDDASPEVVALRRERHRAVQGAVDALLPDARRAVVLAARGFTGREVAAAIGRTDAATRTLLCRSRARLRARLAEVTAG